MDTLVGGAGNDTYIVDITATGALQDTVTEVSSAETDSVNLRGTSINLTAVTLNMPQTLKTSILAILELVY